MPFISQIQVDHRHLLHIISYQVFWFYVLSSSTGCKFMHCHYYWFDSNAENCFYILILHFQNEGKQHYNSEVVAKKQKENKYYASFSK